MPQYNKGFYKVEEGKVVKQPMKGYRRNNRRKPTPAENKLWGILQESFGKGFVARQVIFGWYILDFVVMEKLTAVEVDGEYHEDRRSYDFSRDMWVGLCGIDVLRYPNRVVFEDPQRIITDILKKPKQHIQKYKDSIKRAHFKRRQDQANELRKIGKAFDEHGHLRDINQVETAKAIAWEIASHKEVTITRGRGKDRKRPRCPNCDRGVAGHWKTCEGCGATIHFV